MLLLSFTSIPYYAYHWLGTTNSELINKPNIIVLLGGNGMPSADGLLRTYYTADVATKYPKATVVIALPSDDEIGMLQSKLMANELLLKGIDSARITYEPDGFNTHSQAMNIADVYKTKLSLASVLLITSPEHMYRAVETFRKAGFATVEGVATFEKPVGELKLIDKMGKKKEGVNNLTLRYNMWSYLHYELLVMKEYCAIAYYKIKGWI